MENPGKGEWRFSVNTHCVEHWEWESFRSGWNTGGNLGQSLRRPKRVSSVMCVLRLWHFLALKSPFFVFPPCYPFSLKMNWRTDWGEGEDWIRDADKEDVGGALGCKIITRTPGIVLYYTFLKRLVLGEQPGSCREMTTVPNQLCTSQEYLKILFVFIKGGHFSFSFS